MSKRLLLLLVAAGVSAAVAADDAVAVIASLDGEAFVTVSGRDAPAHAFDWLSAGSQVKTARGARLVVAFRSGRRYELGQLSSAALAAGGLTRTTGSVRELAKFPPMPTVAPIAGQLQASSRLAAIRVRGARPVSSLYPRDGATVLADTPVLRFAPLDGVASYQVDLADASGRIVWHTETAAAEVAVPAGVVKPGASYLWSVRAEVDEGGGPRGSAGFVALSAELASQRAAFRAAVTGSSPDSLVLLAGVDSSLGLLAEARDELRQAAKTSSHPEEIRVLLEGMARQFPEWAGK